MNCVFLNLKNDIDLFLKMSEDLPMKNVLHELRMTIIHFVWQGDSGKYKERVCEVSDVLET